MWNNNFSFMTGLIMYCIKLLSFTVFKIIQSITISLEIWDLLVTASERTLITAKFSGLLYLRRSSKLYPPLNVESNLTYHHYKFKMNQKNSIVALPAILKPGRFRV